MPTRVLVVDDEIDTLYLLRTILEISGYEPITTLNSIEALDLAQAEDPDVVLLDIMMPKLDGFALCKMMRANSATKELPIIFVTAYEALDLEDRRRDAGADLVIRKPIDVDGLVHSIAKARKIRKADNLLGSVSKEDETVETSAAAETAQASETKSNGTETIKNDKPEIKS